MGGNGTVSSYACILPVTYILLRLGTKAAETLRRSHACHTASDPAEMAPDGLLLAHRRFPRDSGTSVSVCQRSSSWRASCGKSTTSSTVWRCCILSVGQMFLPFYSLPKVFFISAKHGYLRNDNIAMSMNYIRYSFIVNREILVTSLKFVKCPMFRFIRFLKEINQLQHGDLNWDSHLIARVEKPLSFNPFGWTHSHLG